MESQNRPKLDYLQKNQIYGSTCVYETLVLIPVYMKHFD